MTFDVVTDSGIRHIMFPVAPAKRPEHCSWCDKPILPGPLGFRCICEREVSQ